MGSQSHLMKKTAAWMALSLAAGQAFGQTKGFVPEEVPLIATPLEALEAPAVNAEAVAPVSMNLDTLSEAPPLATSFDDLKGLAIEAQPRAANPAAPSTALEAAGLRALSSQDFNVASPRLRAFFDVASAGPALSATREEGDAVDAADSVPVDRQLVLKFRKTAEFDDGFLGGIIEAPVRQDHIDNVLDRNHLSLLSKRADGSYRVSIGPPTAQLIKSLSREPIVKSAAPLMSERANPKSVPAEQQLVVRFKTRAEFDDGFLGGIVEGRVRKGHIDEVLRLHQLTVLEKRADGSYRVSIGDQSVDDVISLLSQDTVVRSATPLVPRPPDADLYASRAEDAKSIPVERQLVVRFKKSAVLWKIQGLLHDYGLHVIEKRSDWYYRVSIGMPTDRLVRFLSDETVVQSAEPVAAKQTK